MLVCQWCHPEGCELVTFLDICNMFPDDLLASMLHQPGVLCLITTVKDLIPQLFEKMGGIAESHFILSILYSNNSAWTLLSILSSCMCSSSRITHPKLPRLPHCQKIDGVRVRQRRRQLSCRIIFQSFNILFK